MDATRDRGVKRRAIVHQTHDAEPPSVLHTLNVCTYVCTGHVRTETVPSKSYVRGTGVMHNIERGVTLGGKDDGVYDCGGECTTPRPATNLGEPSGKW